MKNRRLSLAIAISLTALAMGITGAQARWRKDKPHTPYAKWFASLYHDGISCCDTADGHRLSPEYVRRNPTGKTQYQFKATREAFGIAGDEQWHDIPDDKLIRGRELAKFGGNPLGLWVIFSAIIWDNQQRATFQIYCAIPSSAT